MKTINVESIVELITVGNGSINSYALSHLIGVNHKDFVKKLAVRLLKVKRDEISMEDIHNMFADGTLVLPVQVEYTSGNNATSTRIEYVMNEHVAYKMAMRYSDALSDMIYDAYVMYRETLEKIASGAANPMTLAIDALDKDYIAKRKKGVRGALSRYVAKIFETMIDPIMSYEHIMDVYDNLYFNTETREKFYNTIESKVIDIRDHYRKTVNKFDSDFYNKYDQVLSAIYKRQRTKARRNRTDKNKVAVTEYIRANKSKDVAFKVADMYKKEKHEKEMIQEHLEFIQGSALTLN